ncbi:MAG: hypothetical protein ACI85F_002772, partial [Bacteroidia bacterium]
DFHNILEGKNDPNVDRLKVLQSVVEKYPYFTAAQVLLAKEMWEQDHISKQDQIQQAAIRVVDRAALHHFIHSDQPEVEEKEEAELTVVEQEETQILEEAKPGLPDELIPDLAVYDISMADPVTEDPAEVVPSEIATEPAEDGSEFSFVDWLKHVDEEEKSIQKPKLEKKSRTDLVDQFLVNEPRIEGGAHPKFYSPQEMGRKSVQDDFDFVSETLADIYEQQGDFEKAAKAFESLMLKYPEKSSYFAARLKKLGTTE